MKKLMILAVAMVAMALGGKAEAAFRLTVSATNNANVTTTQYFYAGGSSNSATINFTFAGFDGPNPPAILDGTADVLSSNYPGTTDIALIKQNIKLYNNTGGAVSNAIMNGLSFTVEIIDEIVGPVNQGTLALATLSLWNNPLGFNTVATDISAANSGLINNGTVYSATGVNGSTVDMTATVAATNGADSTAALNNPLNLVGPFTLSNTVKVTGMNVPADRQNIQFTGTSYIRPVPAVPEPTSMALAGFAGIGMAVGAIRRRRQAKPKA